MAETKQDLQAIIDDAPDDSWTHVGIYTQYPTNSPAYFVRCRNEKTGIFRYMWKAKQGEHSFWLEQKTFTADVHARADIEAQIKLMEEVERLSEAWVNVQTYPFGSRGYESARKVFEPNYKNP